MDDWRISQNKKEKMSDSFWDAIPERFKYFTIDKHGMKAVHTEQPMYHAQGKWIAAKRDPAYKPATIEDRERWPLVPSGGERYDLGLAPTYPGFNPGASLQKRPEAAVAAKVERAAEPEAKKPIIYAVEDGEAVAPTEPVQKITIKNGVVQDTPSVRVSYEKKPRAMPPVIKDADPQPPSANNKALAPTVKIFGNPKPDSFLSDLDSLPVAPEFAEQEWTPEVEAPELETERKPGVDWFPPSTTDFQVSTFYTLKDILNTLRDVQKALKAESARDPRLFEECLRHIEIDLTAVGVSVAHVEKMLRNG